MLNQRNKEDKSNFVNTNFFESIKTRSLQYIQAGYPIHFIGPSGVGKTSLALFIAQQLNKPVTIIRGHHELSNKDLLGYYHGFYKKEVIDNYIHSVYKKEQEIKPTWINGQLVDAVINGNTIIYDEFSRSRPETNNIFLALLEEKALPIYGKGKETFIKCHPNFSIIFTSNSDDYVGTFHAQDALLDRLITIRLDHCDKETEIKILQQKAHLNFQEAQEIVNLVSNLRTYGNGYNPSLRASLMIGTIAKKANILIVNTSKQYQTLCLDVLSRPMKQVLPDLSHAAIQELILQEIRRKDKDK